MLKPDKWQAAFDSDGKIFGFHKALKSIVLGVRSFIVGFGVKLPSLFTITPA